MLTGACAPEDELLSGGKAEVEKPPVMTAEVGLPEALALMVELPGLEEAGEPAILEVEMPEVELPAIPEDDENPALLVGLLEAVELATLEVGIPEAPGLELPEIPEVDEAPGPVVVVLPGPTGGAGETRFA